MKKKKERRGGIRPGQGPRLKYGEETTTIRIPISLAPEIEKKLARIAKKVGANYKFGS